MPFEIICIWIRSIHTSPHHQPCWFSVFGRNCSDKQEREKKIFWVVENRWISCEVYLLVNLCFRCSNRHKSLKISECVTIFYAESVAKLEDEAREKSIFRITAMEFSETARADNLFWMCPKEVFGVMNVCTRKKTDSPRSVDDDVIFK